MRTLLLVDGEHYPPVIVDAVPHLRSAGYDPVAALFMGGFEKTATPPDLGIPLLHADPEASLVSLIETHDIEAVLDLSDEPILDHRSRFRLVSLAIAHGARYDAGGMTFAPIPRPRLTSLPTISVTGTGKRTGKTAVSIDLARHLVKTGLRPCIVTMGRGGPAAPVVLSAGSLGDPEAALSDLVSRGLHATSDYVEDAIFAGVDTIGTRRLGAGPSGVTVTDSFASGVAIAVSLSPDLLIFEGSGTTIPPAAADRTVTVAPTSIDVEFLTGYLGPARLEISDALILVGTEAERIAASVARTRPHLPIFQATLRPEPTTPVEGRRVVAVTTAPHGVVPMIREELVAQGAASVLVISSLSDRRTLGADLDSVREGDLVLTEVKAAAADIVLPLVRERSADLGLIHNAVDLDPGWPTLLRLLKPTASTSPL